MKFRQIAIVFALGLLCSNGICYSQVETREYWQDNKRYLLCADGPANHYSVLEMATGRQLTNQDAKDMWDSANNKLGPLRSIPLKYYLDTFSVQHNTWCAWNNCSIDRGIYLPDIKVLPDKNNKPGTVYAGNIPGFDDLLKNDNQLVKKWKKDDKKQSVTRWYHSPILRYDTTHRRVFMVGYSGISWVSEDSLEQGAKKVIGEVPGLRLQSVASPQYHRYIFLLYVQQGIKDVWHDEKRICRVFDTHTMQLLKLPESDYMTDPSFAFCPSGDYVFAVHSRVVAPWSTFSPYVINLRDWKVESKLQQKGAIEEMRFYLHGNLLYLNSTWHLGESAVWVLDLSKDEKEIFRYTSKK